SQKLVIGKNKFGRRGAYNGLRADRRRWMSDQAGVSAVHSLYMFLQFYDVSLALDNHVIWKRCNNYGRMRCHPK
ncbi:hypothetical protein A2U01_0005465, partial [Trifolium medium]|nr:hypothetical protein [Trifolium medium]